MYLVRFGSVELLRFEADSLASAFRAYIPGSTLNSSTILHPWCVTSGCNRNDDVHALMETFEGQARFSSRERSPGHCSSAGNFNYTFMQFQDCHVNQTQCQQCEDTLKARTVIDGMTSGRHSHKITSLFRIPQRNPNLPIQHFVFFIFLHRLR